MKNNDHISRTQLMTMVWAGLLAPAAELLPGLTLPAAGKGAWLAPLPPLLWRWYRAGCWDGFPGGGGWRSPFASGWAGQGETCSSLYI